MYNICIVSLCTDLDITIPHGMTCLLLTVRAGDKHRCLFTILELFSAFTFQNRSTF